MYVSVTGLKTKGVIAWLRFLMLTIPASRAAQNAEGVLLCEFKTSKGCHHTFTVWKTKQHMMAYKNSAAHLRAMRGFSKIASGKVFGYEADYIPSWEDALAEFDDKAREV